MYVKHILLRNFRNYKELDLDLTPYINIFHGENAQGKTNLLEGVYYCASGRSHRTSNDRECILRGQDEALIQIQYDIRGKEESIEIRLRQNGRKTILVNDYPVKKISELIGRFHVVVFSPEDLSLIKNGPQFRRKFIDLELSQVDPIYLHDLQQYYHVLKQRNKLLKETGDPQVIRDTVFAWDRQLVYYGERIMKCRARFIEKLEQYTTAIHEEITRDSRNTEHMTIRYENQAPMEAEVFARVLSEHLDRDLRLGVTGDGPQHDDMIIYLNDVDVRTYGSQGQQRTSALSLKLAELKMMKDETGEAPVLLLDDVMSELDKHRQLQLTTYIRENQTILTCTGVEDSLRLLQAQGMYHVSEGTVV